MLVQRFTTTVSTTVLDPQGSWCWRFWTSIEVCVLKGEFGYYSLVGLLGCHLHTLPINTHANSGCWGQFRYLKSAPELHFYFKRPLITLFLWFRVWWCWLSRCLFLSLLIWLVGGLINHWGLIIWQISPSGRTFTLNHQIKCNSGWVSGKQFCGRLKNEPLSLASARVSLAGPSY